MSIAPLVAMAAGATLTGVNPYSVGATILLLLVLAMVALLAFGRGRDHS
jgi:hypothetical protein